MTEHDLNSFIDGLVEEAVLEHKLDMCGTWSFCFDVRTGLGVWRQLPCNDYRHCPICLERKIEDWRRAFSEVGEVFLTTVKEEKWKETARKWKREGRTWYQAPIEGGRIVFFDQRYGTERKVRMDFFSGPTGTKAILKNAHLLTIGDILVQMPKDRRVGGKLVRLSPPKDVEEGAERVQIEVIVPEPEKELEVMAAVKAATEKTAHLDPKNASEAEESYAVRMAVLKAELQERNIKVVSSHTEYRYVKSDAIRWGRRHLATDLQERAEESNHSFVFALEGAKQQEMSLR